MTVETLCCKWTQPTARCEEPPVFRLLHTLSPNGCQFTDVFCRAHVDRRANQIRAGGGEILAVEDVEPAS